jgi:hypothetical protein
MYIDHALFANIPVLAIQVAPSAPLGIDIPCIRLEGTI